MPVFAVVLDLVEQRLRGKRATGKFVLQVDQGYVESETAYTILMPLECGWENGRPRLRPGSLFKRSIKGITMHQHMLGTDWMDSSTTGKALVVLVGAKLTMSQQCALAAKKNNTATGTALTAG